MDSWSLHFCSERQLTGLFGGDVWPHPLSMRSIPIILFLSLLVVVSPLYQRRIILLRCKSGLEAYPENEQD